VADTGALPERYGEAHLIGRGGMGEIFLAQDRALGRPVAIKVLAERYSNEESLRTRFTREALAAARLSTHPHVVTIFDVGEWKQRPFIVMEFLPGGTLAERAEEGQVGRRRSLDWLEQTSLALDAAHAEGIVHRDVKPANLLLDERENVHVADFGVARVLDETISGLTATGTVIGTAGYLSPEQAHGQQATAASDLYSLGVVAYELLTGGRPFERDSATAEAAAHIHEPVPPASERGVGLPRAVDAVFKRALAKAPERRYPSAGAFVSALRSALTADEAAPTRVLPAAAADTRPSPRQAGRGRPRRRGPAAPLLVAAGLLLALLLGGAVAAGLLTGERESPTATRAPQRVTVTQAETRTAEGTTIVETETVVTTEPAPPPPPETEGGGGAGGDGGAVSLEEAAALNDEAFVEHMQEDDYEGALPLLERAVPALRATYSADFPYEAYAEYNLGKTLAELGRCDEALSHLDRSEQLQGEKAPITAAKEQCDA
jgi:eukaryotic-like serine/threonine-protein kinase